MVPSRILAGSGPPSPLITVSPFRIPFPDFRSLESLLSCVVEIGAWPGLGTPLVSLGGIHRK